MILNMALIMINTILITIQVVIINFRHKSSYNIISIMNHQKVSIYNMLIIEIQRCITGVLCSNHMLFKLYSTYIMDLTHISRLEFICIIITSFKPKSNMNQHKSSTYNIINIAYPTWLQYVTKHIYLILWFKQQIIHQISSKIKATY